MGVYRERHKAAGREGVCTKYSVCKSRVQLTLERAEAGQLGVPPLKYCRAVQGVQGTLVVQTTLNLEETKHTKETTPAVIYTYVPSSRGFVGMTISIG